METGRGVTLPVYYVKNAYIQNYPLEYSNILCYYSYERCSILVRMTVPR